MHDKKLNWHHDRKANWHLLIAQVLVTRYDQLSNSSCTMVSHTLQIWLFICFHFVAEWET